MQNIQCPRCNTVNEVTISNEEMLGAVVPVTQCNLCGESWTDHRADEIIDAAAILALKEKP